MAITLKIISPTQLPAGQSRECVIDELGGTIGRKPHNDFVLVDPERFISSKHADIEFRQGQYYITDTSTNGVFINDSREPLGNGHSRPLSSGDKISIGDFDMLVEVSDHAPATPAVESLWSQPSPTPQTPNNATQSSIEDMLGQPQKISPPGSADIFSSNTADSNNVDPLALLDGGAPAAQQNSDTSPAASLLSEDDFGLDVKSLAPEQEADDFFSPSKSDIPPPSPLHEPFTPPSTTIPDNWDDDDLFSVEPPQAAAPKKATQPVITEQPVDDIFAALETPTPSPSNTAPAEAQPTPPIAPQATSTDNFHIDDFLTENQQPSAAQIPPTPVAPPATVTPEVAQQPKPKTVSPVAPVHAPTTETDEALLNAFFQGAGIDPGTLRFADKHALMQKIGLLTRMNTEGVMVALRARSTIKSSFRVNKTTIAPVENNPLKFLVTANDALATLLSDDRPGYMPAKQAVDEAYRDLQTHQLAMMAGMQGTIRAILDQFNPRTLEQNFSKAGGGGLLPGSKKSKNWDEYVTFYQRISDQIIDDFQHLFGEEFARAYESQVQKLNK